MSKNMSFNYNHITLVGKVVYKGVCETSKIEIHLKVERPYRKANGESIKDFIVCQFWGQLAKISAKAFDNGATLLVEGQLQICKSTNMAMVVTENFHILDTCKK